MRTPDYLRRAAFALGIALGSMGGDRATNAQEAPPTPHISGNETAGGRATIPLDVPIGSEHSSASTAEQPTTETEDNTAVASASGRQTPAERAEIEAHNAAVMNQEREFGREPIEVNIPESGLDSLNLQVVQDDSGRPWFIDQGGRRVRPLDFTGKEIFIYNAGEETNGCRYYTVDGPIPNNIEGFIEVNGGTVAQPIGFTVEIARNGDFARFLRPGEIIDRGTIQLTGNE
jgi:hypothetical protein